MNSIYHTPQAKYIRILYWCYIILLLFEGALRKWITPGLSNPLLIIRDPFAIAIYAISLQIGIFPRNKYANQLFILAIACGLVSLLTPAGLKITAFGLRIEAEIGNLLIDEIISVYRSNETVQL